MLGRAKGKIELAFVGFTGGGLLEKGCFKWVFPGHSQSQISLPVDLKGLEEWNRSCPPVTDTLKSIPVTP